MYFFGFGNSSFHINYDLAPLAHMIKTMSLRLSEQARQRLAWMDAFRECGNAAQVCRHFSIPLRTFWRWRKRYDPWNLKSLENRSRKPKTSPRRTTWNIQLAVMRLKLKHPRWGKEKIALSLFKKEGIKLSGKTCWRLLKRKQLIVCYRTRKRKAPKPRVNWAEIRLPGDLLELDTKHISQNGERLYQYTLIDVISRWRYANIYRNADMKTTIRFLSMAKTLSSFKWQKIQTDNGGEFGSLVSKWCQNNNTRHVFSHKSRPVENGHVERSHRIDEEEFYSIESMGDSLNALRTRFVEYLNMYNTERPHWGLGGKTPLEALNTYLTNQPCHMS